jgi:hypothetical protein
MPRGSRSRDGAELGAPVPDPQADPMEGSSAQRYVKRHQIYQNLNVIRQLDRSRNPHFAGLFEGRIRGRTSNLIGEALVTGMVA